MFSLISSQIRRDRSASITQMSAGMIVQMTSSRLLPCVYFATRPSRCRYFQRKRSRIASTTTKMMPVIHMMRWNMPSICGAYVDACSGRCIQKGSARPAAGESAAAETKSATRRIRAARVTGVMFFTVG